MPRVCAREGCGKRLIRKEGSPDYHRHFCGPECKNADKRERMQEKRQQPQGSVGFADNSSSSANFPVPWNSPNAQINFVGGGTVYRPGTYSILFITFAMCAGRETRG
jgi:endogenous inhibitor of DNA gyrase (YacG/DUF329 family)